MEFQTNHLNSDDIKELCIFAFKNCEIWYGEVFEYYEEDEDSSIDDILSQVGDDYEFKIIINKDLEMGFYESNCYCWFILDKSYISNVASLV